MIEEIKKKASELHPQLVEWRRHMHSHPELSYEEFETSKFIQSILSQMGVPFEVVSKTGIVAMIHGKSSDRVVALRADIDALPIQEQNKTDYASQNAGVMHACGHDVHTTSLLGTTSILNSMKDELNGSVKLIFQLGEEKLPGGASLMIKEGVLENPKPKAIIGQHVYPDLEAGKVGFRPGKYMASADEVYLTVKGKGGHAALPHKNIDAVLMASHIVVALQQVVSRRCPADIPCVLSFGKIIGEGATNVLPDKVELEGTFRTFDETWRYQAHDIIREIASTTAKAFGGECDVDVRVGYPFVDNDPTTTAHAKRAAEEFLGKENVIDLDLRMTAEDFAFYSQMIPGCFYRLGTRVKGEAMRGLHTPTFDVDEASLETGAGLMAYAAIKELNS